MSWAVGYDPNWLRDVGYGVPSICDQPGCGKQINRGLSYVCGGAIWGGEKGCGLYFCETHLYYGDNEDDPPSWCDRCACNQEPYKPTPDTEEWIRWKLTDESWQQWREDHPDEVAKLHVP